MSNPHSAEVKEDKREWWLLKDAQHDYLEHEPTRHTVSDFIHVVPASEKQRLQNEIDNLKLELCSDIDSDGPELSCPYIDGVIKRFPESANTMEYVRTINSQLRHDRDGYATMYKELQTLLDEAVNLLKAIDTTLYGEWSSKRREFLERIKK